MSAPAWAVPWCWGCGVKLEHRKGGGRPRILCGSAQCQYARAVYKATGDRPKNPVCPDCKERWGKVKLCACERAMIEERRGTVA